MSVSSQSRSENGEGLVHKHPRTLLLVNAVMALSACGGGGTRVASIPAAPGTPPPPPTSAVVNIFPSPAPETYASVGVGVDRSTADVDQPHIRYTSGGFYEIQMPGSIYEQLIPLKGFVPQDPATNNQFQPSSAPQNAAYFFTSNSRLAGYRYSEMASWASSQIGGGYVAFGSATPAGAVPVTGSATYSGVVEGRSDILEDWGDWGINALDVKGDVGLAFNFGAGTLDGLMSLTANSLDGPLDLGTFDFKDTVYSTGSPTYTGAFSTTGTGSNFFLGRFTGPNAQETIGAWGLPFVLSGENHQAFGTWIAKKDP